MKRVTLIILMVVLAASPLLVSCGGNGGDEVPAVFKSIKPLDLTVVLPAGGSDEIRFQVEDPDYSFNFNAYSPECNIELRLQGGGVPTDFKITRIIKTEGEGIYTATITDQGTNPIYKKSVCLAMKLGESSLILSKQFTVMSESAGSDELIVNTGLPIVYVNTAGNKSITSKTTDVEATFKINGMGKTDNLEELSCRIRGRGNTTWTWPKKPYLVKLDKKQSIFGLPEHKRWVLLANFMDRTLMRNVVSMKVASMMSNLDWTPHGQSVELVLNGSHQGTYLLVEQVRADEDRVPCENGYLLECDFHYDNPIQWIDYHGRCNQRGDGIPFGVKYPDSDELSQQQLTYIKNYVSTAATVLYGGNFTNATNGYTKYLDVASFIDYWIVFEVMGNHELGNPGSVFMHMNREGGKLIAGPVWDFDWGVLSYKTSPQAKYGLLNDKAIWYARLFEDPAFKEAVRKRWNEVLPKLQTIPAFIDETEKALQASANLNFKMWNPAGDATQNGGSIINGDENMSYNDAVALLKHNYKERLEVISKSL